MEDQEFEGGRLGRIRQRAIEDHPRDLCEETPFEGRAGTVDVATNSRRLGVADDPRRQPQVSRSQRRKTRRGAQQEVAEVLPEKSRKTQITAKNTLKARWIQIRNRVMDTHHTENTNHS